VVPGHPIAGSENSGIEASDAQLFAGKRVILTPLEETLEDATVAVQSLWQMPGAEVELLDPEYHDRVLAATSHLPHVLAFSLVDTLATHQEAEEIFRYAAGGFKDFTRIASSDAVMWRDVSLTNRQALLDSMDSFSAHLETLRKAIEQRDGETIEAIFKRARAARDAHTR
jgi:prephenate dehydrogenase